MRLFLIFVTAGLRFVPYKLEIEKKEVIIIRLSESKRHVQTPSIVSKITTDLTQTNNFQIRNMS